MKKTDAVAREALGEALGVLGEVKDGLRELFFASSPNRPAKDQARLETLLKSLVRGVRKTRVSQRLIGISNQDLVFRAICRHTLKYGGRTGLSCRQLQARLGIDDSEVAKICKPLVSADHITVSRGNRAGYRATPAGIEAYRSKFPDEVAEFKKQLNTIAPHRRSKETTTGQDGALAS